MLDIPSSNAFEFLIALLLAILFIVELTLAVQERNLPGFMGIGIMACLTTFALMVFYFLLAIDADWLADDISLRLAIFRPTFVAWIVFLIVKLTILSIVWRRRGLANRL